MNYTLSSISKDDNDQLGQREKITLNHFLSFHENTLSSVENRRLINKSTSNIIEEEKDHLNANLCISYSYECDQCLKVFASEYGLNYHMNMHHSNQSILCSDCQITFRSHRALKNHQQRFHFTHSQTIIPNYTYVSSYLNVGFSTELFPLITKNACEQGRLPLSQLTSKLFSCQLCHLSFPCSKALKYHLLSKHEQYEYELCKNILYEIILQVEQNLKTVNDDDNIESMKLLLSKQASQFGLVDKQLAREIRCLKHEHNRLIFPTCQHQNRTCANLCLKYLSTYNKLTQNYSYNIPLVPKGNPFAQGSIVSKPINALSVNDTSMTGKHEWNINQKRTSLKRVKSSISDRSSSPQSKRKLLSTIEQPIKTNEIKTSFVEQSSPKKSLSKVNHSYTRSLSSLSSSSSTSTRIPSKTSRQQQTGNSLKRSTSPILTLAVERSSEKRRRQRERRKARKTLSSSTSIIKIDDDIEQENDDDDDDSIIPTESEKPKRQRQASNSSVEYVQILNHDKQSVPSLNNIENLKLKSNIDDKDILVCQSPPVAKKITSSLNKNQSKSSVNNNNSHKVNGHQTSDYDEHIRVRCKICGDILEGRSRFSKHVLTMHSHLLKNKTSGINQQPTTIVR